MNRGRTDRDETAARDDAASSLLVATSSEVGPNGEVSIVLAWQAATGYQGYNLYRAQEGAARLRRLNGRRPIAPVATCSQLRRVIPEGSHDWNVLTSAFTALAARADPETEPVTPCDALDRGLRADEIALWDDIATGSLAMQLARGTAFVDTKVVPDVRYSYELRGLARGGGEAVLATGVLVVAGRFLLPDPPSGLTAHAGDHKVLLLWNRNPYADTYAVQRSTNAGGPFQAINPEPVAMDVEHDISGAAIVPPRPGFLDFQRWDAAGLPVGHVVDGTLVSGPDNATTYWYRVASRDALDRLGAWSSPVAATPVRTTPPMAPEEVLVSPQVAPTGLRVSWRKVTRDVDNHVLPDVTQTYEIFRAADRADLENLSGLPLLQVATVVANPLDPTTPTLSWSDVDPALAPAYGQQTYFYRVRCRDPLGNTSAPSAIAGAAVPDTTPPGPTEPDGADGDADHITVHWQPNPEPDVAGYLVYRGVCDRGVMYTPGRKREGEPTGKCDMTLVGQVPLSDAEKMVKANGRISFEDFSVPAGSPVCYGYWVRAYDQAGNLYPGNDGCPRRREEYVCMRLRERTAPPPPIVTALRARDRAVLVEWIASPIQDLRAFHVYRSRKELDPPDFLACVFVDGTVSSSRWGGLAPSCADIPAEPDPLAARGEYLDQTAVPGEIYWYRVSALDWLGNESEGGDLVQLPSSSTFTYRRDVPAAPVLNPPIGSTVPDCGLEISWSPAFDAAALEGYAVFRSANGGPFRQVSEIVAGNTFVDVSARRGVAYRYCVQAVDRAGRLSEPSGVVAHSY